MKEIYCLLEKGMSLEDSFKFSFNPFKAGGNF